MQRFLRQFRKNLLTGGRVTRYLLYALGEIFLVVIGILIALKVNNWNIENIALKEEKVIQIAGIIDPAEN